MTKSLNKFAKSEAKYILIFILTGLIVSFLADKFGLDKSHYTYHLVRKVLYAVL